MTVEEPRENYTTGWVKIYRSVRKHWLWVKPLSKMEAWMDIILEANHSPEKVNFGNDLFICERGEKMYSFDTWGERWGWHKSRVRRFLKLLEDDSMIELKMNRYTTHLRVCNYSTYQDVRNGSETEVNLKRNGSESQTTPIKELKKYKELKNERITTVDDREIVIKDYFLDLLPIDSKEDFIKTWVDWVDYKKEIKNKLTIRSAKMQVSFLLKQPNPIKVIEQSIEKGWKGLFEINGKGEHIGTKPNYVSPEEVQRGLKNLFEGRT